MKWFFTHEVHKISIFSHEKFANTKEPFYNTMIKTCTKFWTQKKKKWPFKCTTYNIHTSITRACYVSKLASIHTIFALILFPDFFWGGWRDVGAITRELKGVASFEKRVRQHKNSGQNMVRTRIQYMYTNHYS